MAVRRLQDLSRITREAFFEFYDRYVWDQRRRTISKSDRGDFYANQDLRVGRRFFDAVVTALRDGAITYIEAYRLVGLHGKTFHDYEKRVMSGSDGRWMDCSVCARQGMHCSNP